MRDMKIAAPCTAALRHTSEREQMRAAMMPMISLQLERCHSTRVSHNSTTTSVIRTQFDPYSSIHSHEDSTMSRAGLWFKVMVG